MCEVGRLRRAGLNYQINETGELDHVDWENMPRVSGTITPIGGAFDIFGIWDAFASSTEDQPGVAILTFLLTKGKGKMSTTLGFRSPLPRLDATGKVHGILPRVKDLIKYSKGELKILLNELRLSVKRRIEVTSIMGRDRAHGQRQGAEQDLIKSIEKYLKK